MSPFVKEEKNLETQANFVTAGKKQNQDLDTFYGGEKDEQKKFQSQMAKIDRGLEPAQYSPSQDLENLKRKLKGE